MISQELKDAFLVHFESPEHLKNWVLTYLDIDLPMGHIDPDSNSSPVEAMYEAYSNYKLDKSFETPGYIWLSARDCYKTLAESILNVILMIHFGASIAHLASVKSQSEKAISYVNTFLRKLKPYLEYHKMIISSESKSKAQITLPSGDIAYVNVIICTVSGANSEHVPYMSFDELDTIRFPQAYEEAKLIPARFGNRGPLTVKCSTRKYAFGIMEKEISLSKETGEKVLRWNILDVTEKCPESLHRPDLPKEIRYIHPRLPLRNLSKKELDDLDPQQRSEFVPIEAYAGCANCVLLPVCKTRLAHRPADNVGGFYKPIRLTIRQFKITSPDMAEAQLLCWKPSTSGLIYPRFEESGNVINIEQAYEKLTDSKPPKNCTLSDIVSHLLLKGHKFYAGVDWGFRHAFAIVVSVIVGNEWWIIDSYSVPGLEFDQMIALSVSVRDKYKVSKWFADTSQPMFIKEFKKRGMPCVKFTKDVMGGIECVRKKIVDASNFRSLKVFDHENNKWLIEGFKKHHFKLDSAGNPTQEPDDEEYADIMDALRYVAQNLFSKSKVVAPPPLNINELTGRNLQSPAPITSDGDWLFQKVRELTKGTDLNSKGKSEGVIWDFTDPLDSE